LARLQLKKFNPEIIGITGSVGKTSCRNAVYAVLKNKHQVKVSYKANSETGIPLSILGFPSRNYSLLDWFWILPLAPIKLLTNWRFYRKLVVELGVDSPFEPKNMGYLLTIVNPHIGIFLNALPVHSQAFDSLVKDTDPQLRRQQITRLIANEKGKLIASLPPQGLAILNADDPNVIAFKTKTRAPVMTFGQATTNDIIIGPVKSNLKGTRFTFATASQSTTAFFKNLSLNKHYASTFAAALCLSLSKGQSLPQAVKLLVSHFVMPKGRMTIIPGVNHSLILDSSYNASTLPMLGALETLSSLAPQRKLALLGDMRELGREAKLEHQQVARKALAVCDAVYLVGPLMKQFVLPIINKQKPVFWFANAKLAAAKLKQDLKPQDLLLVKGSQNTIFLEYAVAKLMAKPQDVQKLLCRQGSFWDKTRARSGLS
jgi:UDP-N-acetylmuramyl pentapeptide synthase